MGLCKGPSLSPSQALGSSTAVCRHTYGNPQDETNMDSRRIGERTPQNSKNSPSGHAQVNPYAAVPFESHISVQKSGNGGAGSTDAQAGYYDRSSRPTSNFSTPSNIDAQERRRPQQWCPVCGQAYEDETPLMLQCEGCQIWVHGSCVGLSSSGYSRLQSSEGDPYEFFCPECFKEHPSRQKRTQSLLSFALAEQSRAHSFMEMGRGPKLSHPEIPKSISSRNLRRRNGTIKDTPSTGPTPEGQGMPVPDLVSVYNGDLSKSITCLAPIPANEQTATAPSSSFASTPPAANEMQPTPVEVTNPSAGPNGNGSFPSAVAPHVLLVKPPDAYMLFRYALTAANPQLEEAVLQRLARKEWLSLGKGDRRKFVSEAAKLMTKYRLDMAANQQRDEPKKKRQRTAD